MVAMVGVVVAQSSASDIHGRIEHSPSDVAAFIERRISCNHWEGEVFPNGFQPRQREVRRALSNLHCSSIEGDALRLSRKYHARPEVISLLNETEQMLPEELRR